MKKVLLLLVLLFSVALADSALIVKKGWSLIGAASKIEDLSIFDDKDVEQVWQYDATTQKWRGFSPDSATQKKMLDKGFSAISSLESWHGFWIKSKHEWSLTFKTDTTQNDGNITLYKGWNLISLPVDTVVSAHIFDDKTVWKYAKKNQWEYFNKESKENFPTISHITNSDGIWVKSDRKQTISVSSKSAKLHNFSNKEEMEAYILDMVLTYDRPICGYYLMGKDIVFREDGEAVFDTEIVANKIATPQVAKDASETNIQEEGVDESDIIKHDGTNIFYVSSKQNSDNYDSQMYINITTFANLTSGNLKPIHRISVNGFVDSIYLVENRLIVLYNYIPNKYDIAVDERDFYISSMAVDILDVSDINDIKKVSTFKLNGSLNSSRMIDGKLFLVTNFRPFVTKKYPRIYVDAPECKEYFQPQSQVDIGEENSVTKVQSKEQQKPTDGGGVTEIVTKQKSKSSRDIIEYKKFARCYGLMVDRDGKYYRFDYENPTIEHQVLIPQVQKDSEAKMDLITPKTLYASSKKNQDATITTVSKFDIASATLEDTSSVLGYAGTIYASKDALYIVSNQYPMYYNFDRYKERSAIYKFSLGDDISYQAQGFINGHVLNQFSLSEYNNILRIATTEGNSWQGYTTNTLYTLSQVDDTLLIDGVLSGLGKDEEMIRSIRFIGNRGYMVTFKQTDPFYTLDLSDASNPIKVGELNITGYSSYLHPIDENHILGIGRDADSEGRVRGLKMELFNIENFANPTSVAVQYFGNQYSYSEMESNHKALAYRASDKLLGFAYNQGGISPRDELGLFQIVGDTIKVYKTVKSADSTGNYGFLQRGLIFDTNNQTYVAFFSNGQIAVERLDNLK